MSINLMEPIVSAYTYSELYNHMEGGDLLDNSDHPPLRAGLSVNRMVPNHTPSRFKNHVVPAGLVFLRDFVPTKETIEYESAANLLYDVMDDALLNRLIDMVRVPMPKSRSFERRNRSNRGREKKRITIRKEIRDR